MGRYKVFDLETTIKAIFKRKANCFDPDNWVVARGWKNQNETRNSWTYHPKLDRTSYLRIEDDITMLIGFNIKFDLMWEMAQGNPDLTAFFARGGRIWDGQYVEYLLQGQDINYQMCSLDQIIESYGGRLKINEVKEMWEAGINTDAIPEDLLIDYLVGTEEEKRHSGDIRNTELVFLGQVAKATKLGMIKMIQDRMDGLLATTEMEFRGLKVDVKEAARRLGELKVKLNETNIRLTEQIKHLPWEFNWGSNVQVSALLFGGTVKYQVREGYLDDDGNPARLKATSVHFVLADGRTTPIDPASEHGPRVAAAIGYAQYGSGKKRGQYKTKNVDVPGALKVKWQDRTYVLPGYTYAEPSWAGKQTDAADKPIFSTGADTIKALTARVENGLDLPFLVDFTSKSALDKEIGTYYVRIDPKKGPVGMLTCVQPVDHMLHHKLNHSSTVTSRLTSNDPNLQNLPRGDKSEVKAMFVSRFGPDGVMVEADYSQLEVVVQGVLSGDKNLCEDLRNKIDFHCKRVSAAEGITYEEALFWCKNEDYEEHALWKKKRTKAKNFSFQRAYGAGADAIAAATGMSKEEVEKLIVAEEAMYPGVVKFNQLVEKMVNASAIPFQAPAEDGTVGPDGKPIWKNYRRGEWFSPTRTRYTWRSHDAPKFMRSRGVMDTFSPPELKNYPVQGTGGEFVQAILGLLWRHFVSNGNYGGKAFLVNTVHDCVWVDCHRDVLDAVAADMKRIMESIPEFYNARYDMKITVPFPVEVECGPNMNNMKHWVPGQPAWHHANDNTEEKHEAA